MDLALLISAFTTLFVVIDPIGTTPVFIALTRGMSPARRRAIALRSCLIAAAILCLFAVAGEAVLGFVGITMPAFRIAGGLLLFLTALDMLFERRTKRREDKAEEAEDDVPDPSVFPMAIPLLAGPGAITSVILLVSRAGDPAELATVFAVMFGVLAIALVLLLTSGFIERVLGKIGITVVTRLLGLLLAALSVQFVADGLLAFGFGTPPG
ncbi:MarC family protein [Roseivivax sp. GX 12232]|uniref:MarC family protein n=1 Tax=Roseivivax sp. GX 12232 TaxID=2900547 RepID=UPI001E37ECCE|nr:MarC family protein [Roseivivax sp. GX 12232]MCE0504599.1 MarC family protein [Roseivivax sp. GX 12232]